ncbi:MAG: hypothetical protein KF866_03715 [Phycisphaeraceae bacterium]|nr:hypothetical protein [Phycisphaeraceae bacterium]MCW5753199.1 hypothetical protein [Phycisphaeraceae bacterium]
MMKLTALLMPLAMLMLARSMGKSVPARFFDAQAFSVETSRRPAGLGIDRAPLLADAVKSGVLVPVGDGRYYVDRAVFLRRRRRFRSAVLASGVVLGIVVYGVLHHLANR